MDTAQLTQSLWNFLQPYLPLLLTEAAKAGGKRVPDAVSRAWQLLTARWAKKPAAAEALEDLRRAPDDADFQAAVRAQIKKLLAADPALAEQLAALVPASATSYRAELHGSGAIAQGPGATAVGERGVYIGGNASGNTIITGDGNEIEG